MMNNPMKPKRPPYETVDPPPISSPPCSAATNPCGSVSQNICASLRPGFQPSSAAHSTKVSSSARLISRMARSGTTRLLLDLLPNVSGWEKCSAQVEVGGSQGRRMRRPAALRMSRRARHASPLRKGKNLHIYSRTGYSCGQTPNSDLDNSRDHVRLNLCGDLAAAVSHGNGLCRAIGCSFQSARVSGFDLVAQGRALTKAYSWM